MRCLLDKVTARYILQGLLKLDEGNIPTRNETFSLNLFLQAASETGQLFVVPSTAKVLIRLHSLARYSNIIQYFQNKPRL